MYRETPALYAKDTTDDGFRWIDANDANGNVFSFFRSDESGTTENFTKYLKAAAEANWPGEPAKTWDGKGEGKAKSAGVA